MLSPNEVSKKIDELVKANGMSVIYVVGDDKSHTVSIVSRWNKLEVLGAASKLNLAVGKAVMEVDANGC
jgi:hypothetical protein